MRSAREGLAKYTHVLDTSFTCSEAQLSERRDAHTNYVRSFGAGNAFSLPRELALIEQDEFTEHPGTAAVCSIGFRGSLNYGGSTSKKFFPRHRFSCTLS